jgi:acyl carrier protein
MSAGTAASRSRSPVTANPPRSSSMPTKTDIQTDLAAIVEEIAGVPAADVQPDKEFVADLDVDSLSMVEIVVAAEEKFGVRIPDDQVKNLRTVGDAVDYIDSASA